MNPIRELRHAAGLTQQQLARAAGTSQSTIAAYEGGSKSPSWRTIVRLANALGFEPQLDFVPPLTREDRRSLALHAAIADRLRADPSAMSERALQSLTRMRALHPHARPLLEEWEQHLRGPLTLLLALLRDPAPRARELRQVTPFTGVLSAAERTAVYRQFARAERARHAHELHAATRAS